MNTSMQSLWKNTLWALVASVIANVIVDVIAKMIIVVPPDFAPAMIAPVAMVTAISTIGAAIVFAIIRKFSKNPNFVFKVVAYIVLIVSFIPDALLLDVQKGITIPVVILLMIFHVVAALIIINRFTKHTVPATAYVKK